MWGTSRLSEMNYLEKDWCNLNWSQWVMFRDSLLLRNLITSQYGFYRVKPAQQNVLAYIGQTNNLRRRILAELIPNTLASIIPYNDPHTAAQSLWTWRDAEGMDFQISFVTTSLEIKEREAKECSLLWQYRIEKGESTICNHGRFHPSYTRSTDRSTGIRGARLPEGQVNPAGGKSFPPLISKGSFNDNDWFGLFWTPSQLLVKEELSKIPNSPGLYKIIDLEKQEILYIGQSYYLRNRITSHNRKNWGTEKVYFSYNVQPTEVLPHQLKELENDLIGGLYWQNSIIPKYQFANLQL